MPDFWLSCGYRLLKAGPDGGLVLTDEFLRATLLRPELAPVAESCPAELALHERLMAAPRAVVADSELLAIVDADARENYGVWLRFRTGSRPRRRSRPRTSRCFGTASTSHPCSFSS
jgi:hypothetical protein